MFVSVKDQIKFHLMFAKTEIVTHGFATHKKYHLCWPLYELYSTQVCGGIIHLENKELKKQKWIRWSLSHFYRNNIEQDWIFHGWYRYHSSIFFLRCFYILSLLKYQVLRKFTFKGISNCSLMWLVSITSARLFMLKNSTNKIE